MVVKSISVQGAALSGTDAGIAGWPNAIWAVEEFVEDDWGNVAWGVIRVFGGEQAEELAEAYRKNLLKLAKDAKRLGMPFQIDARADLRVAAYPVYQE